MLYGSGFFTQHLRILALEMQLAEIIEADCGDHQHNRNHEHESHRHSARQ